MTTPDPLQHVPEKVIQTQVRTMLRSCGHCEVWDLSQPRATMQTPGLPDLLVWVQRLDQSATWAFIEVKAPHGRLSRAQRAFAAFCRHANVPYYVVRSAREMWLVIQDLRAGTPIEGQPVTPDAVAEARRLLALAQLEQRRTRLRRGRNIHDSVHHNTPPMRHPGTVGADA